MRVEGGQYWQEGSVASVAQGQQDQKGNVVSWVREPRPCTWEGLGGGKCLSTDLQSDRHDGSESSGQAHRESPSGDLEGDQWGPQIPWPLDGVWILRTCYSEGARATDWSFPPLQGACQTCGLSGSTPEQQYHTLGWVGGGAGSSCR